MNGWWIAYFIIAGLWLVTCLTVAGINSKYSGDWPITRGALRFAAATPFFPLILVVLCAWRLKEVFIIIRRLSDGN